MISWFWFFSFILVFISALKLKQVFSFFCAFFLGFVLDILFAQNLGFTSIYFLFVSGIIQVLKKRFSFANPLASLILSLFLYFLFRLFTGKSLKIFEVIFLAVLVLIFSPRKKEKLTI